jgi:hypothetical protein
LERRPLPPHGILRRGCGPMHRPLIHPAHRAAARHGPGLTVPFPDPGRYC